MILLRHCLTRFKGSCRCLEFLIPVGRHLSLEYILSLKLCFLFFFSQANANYFTWSKTGARSSTKTLSVVNGTFQERIACFWNLIIDNFMSEKWRVVYSSNFYVGGGFLGQTCISSGTLDLQWLLLWDDVFVNNYELEISIAWQGQSSMNCHAQLSRTDIDTDHSSCFQWQCFFLSKLNE